MTATRLSRLQKQMLRWLRADERRSRGVIASSHQELVQAVPSAKGNLSHSLRLLETRGLIRIGRSPGGRAEYVTLTTAGRQKAGQLTGSYDEGVTVSGTRICHLPCRSRLPLPWCRVPGKRFSLRRH
jgi:DNA-binding MarR family transcriptional regulator